jgi:2-polyprenyl-3-methyl-5-hydroxy-6-metoxy-1,4-benzoquinol methylase
LKQERIAEALSEHTVKTPATFLELGCGAGNVALWMASQGFNAYGVDVEATGKNIPGVRRVAELQLA